VGGDDEQIERAQTALDEATAALHDLASVAARGELGEEWLPMISQLRAQTTSSELTVRQIRRNRGLLAHTVGWENLTEQDRWATLQSMIPLGALFGSVVEYHIRRGWLRFIVDSEPHAMTGREPK